MNLPIKINLSDIVMLIKESKYCSTTYDVDTCRLLVKLKINKTNYKLYLTFKDVSDLYTKYPKTEQLRQLYLAAKERWTYFF